MKGQQESDVPPKRHRYRPVRVKRVFEEICTQIRRQIMTGALKPGDKLPAERDFAAELGVGRAAVREALRSLEISGLIKLQKGVKGGAVIQHVDPGIVSKSVGDMVSVGTISLETLTETRILLIVPMIELVCKRATEQDFDAIEETIRQMEDVKNLHERVMCSRAFYSALAQASHNQLLASLTEATHDVVFGLIEQMAPPVMPNIDVARTRRGILKYLRQRNPQKASKEAKEQLEQLHEFLLANVKRFAASA